MRSGGVFDLPQLQQQIADLEAQASDPDLWSDPQHAHGVMQKLSRLNDELTNWKSLNEQLQTIEELVALADAADTQMLDELVRETERLSKIVDEREIAMLLGGPYDDQPAFLQVQAGAGGVDSQDWAQMLERMYLRWAEQQGWKASIIDEMPGEEAGIKSATIELRGPFAYGNAKAEAGVHRLVRLSPFDQAHRRHTSFARVEVMPEVEDAVDVQIDPDDLRVDVYRSGGHGGQGVNTTDSAVRLTHLQTGLVVTCQDERSQLKNKAKALGVLRARLYAMQEEKRAKEIGSSRLAQVGTGERAEKIRTYNFPQDRITDHRIGQSFSNIPGVLNGNLGPLIAALTVHDNAERLQAVSAVA